MRAGALVHAITIERKIQVGVDELNEPNVVWQTFAEPFAELTVLRGREHFDQTTKQRFAEDVWHFRCNYDDVVGIDQSMRVVDEDGQYFNIKAIRPDAQKRVDTIIECVLVDSRIGAEVLMGYIEDAIEAGAAGIVYAAFTVKARGGTAPYSFVASALPTGLTLHATTGVVSGTPTTPGTTSGIVITVTDAAGDTHAMPAFSITVV